MQRQLSSFDIYIIVDELQELVGCHIEKIYQLSRSELLIRVKNILEKTKSNIYIRNGKLICTTEQDFETPSKPSVFAMTLRKYLSNGKITDISQHEFDRIIKIKISKKEGEFSLIIEFFSNGNIILADPDERIILPLIRQNWAHRKVKGKEMYNPPPPQINPFDLTLGDFRNKIIESDSDVVRTLAVNFNLSGPVAEEICISGKIDKNLEIKDINDETINAIYNSFVSFLKIFKEKNFDPVVVKKDNEIVDVLPFKFESYEGFKLEQIPSFLNGLQYFIKEKKFLEKKEKKTDKILDKLNRKLSMQKETVEKLKEHINIKKLEGDLIYLHYQEIDDLLNKITQVLELKEKEEQIKEINKIDFVEKFDPVENVLKVNLTNTSNEVFKINLNFRKSVSENAEKAYDDNKKLQSKLKGAKKSIDDTYEEIKKAKKVMQKEIKAEESAKKTTKKEKIFWFEKYRWFISSSGNIIIGGKDAKTNELVVKKYLKEGDRYAHADIQGAPSIVIKSKDVNDEPISISNETLEEACIFATSFSKAWKQFAEAQAYWVSPEQVSKTAQSGEFVPKGAFIIRGKRNYYRCKLEVVVGEVEINGIKKIMCGPVNAVKKHSKKYIVINPGDIKKNDMARKLSKVFDVNIDVIDRVLPPGGATITKSEGVSL